MSEVLTGREKAIMRATAKCIREQNEKLWTAANTRLKAIESRLEILEARELKYLGAFRGGQQYKAGNLVSHAGGLWHANEDTSETPGKSNAWTLAVKSGR